MAKINPATKQAEEAKDPTVQEMLNNYDEYKENTDLSTNKFSDDVQSRLPDQAEIKSGTLTVPSPKREAEGDGQPLNFGLTQNRRRVLMTLAQNPDETKTAVAEKAGVSGTTVTYAERAFDFLLDDPVLFDAFVVTGRSSYSTRSEEESEKDEYDGTPWSDRTHNEIVNDHYGENDDEDIVDKALKEVEHEDEGDSPEPCGTTMTDAYSKSEDSADTSGQESRVRTSHNIKADGFTAEQLSKVLNGLYADREPELATEILREMMEE